MQVELLKAVSDAVGKQQGDRKTGYCSRDG